MKGIASPTYPLLEYTNGVPLKLATALVVPSESNSSLGRGEMLGTLDFSANSIYI